MNKRTKLADENFDVLLSLPDSELFLLDSLGFEPIVPQIENEEQAAQVFNNGKHSYLELKPHIQLCFHDLIIEESP